MSALSMGIGAVIALGGAYLAFVQKKKSEGQITELKFSKNSTLPDIKNAWKSVAEQGLGYRDFIETTGKAVTDGQLLSQHGKIPCAYFTATVVREFEKDEMVKDDKGVVQRKTTRGSETVSNQNSPTPLYVEDGGVRVPIDLDGASIDLKDGANRFEPYESNRTYSFWGVSFTVPQGTRTLGFRYAEKIIPLGHPLYIAGEVRESAGNLHIGKPSEKGKPFIVSVKSEEEVVKSREAGAKAQLWFGIALIVVGVAVAIFVK